MYANYIRHYLNIVSRAHNFCQAELVNRLREMLSSSSFSSFTQDWTIRNYVLVTFYVLVAF